MELPLSAQFQLPWLGIRTHSCTDRYSLSSKQVEPLFGGPPVYSRDRVLGRHDREASPSTRADRVPPPEVKTVSSRLFGTAGVALLVHPSENVVLRMAISFLPWQPRRRLCCLCHGRFVLSYRRLTLLKGSACVRAGGCTCSVPQRESICLPRADRVTPPAVKTVLSRLFGAAVAALLVHPSERFALKMAISFYCGSLDVGYVACATGALICPLEG